MAASHFVAYADFPLLRDIAAHHRVYTGRKLLAVGSVKYFYVDNYAVFTVGNTERVVSHVARLVAEYGAEQSFLGGKVGLSLGSNLTHQDIARVHLGAYPDYSPVVKVF